MLPNRLDLLSLFQIFVYVPLRVIFNFTWVDLFRQMAACSHIKHTHGSCNGPKNGTFMSSIIKNPVVLCHHFGIFAVFANHKKNRGCQCQPLSRVLSIKMSLTSHQDFEFHSWPITFLLTSILHTPVCFVHLLLTF